MLASRLAAFVTNCLTVNNAKRIHAQIITNGLNHLESLLIRQILLSHHIYSPSVPQYLEQILLHLDPPDSFSWACTIRFLTQNGEFERALAFYFQMQRSDLLPTTFAVSAALKSCARTVYKLGGISIHAQVLKYGYECCVYAKTALIDLYCKLGDMTNARKLFDEMGERNVVSWNSILSGYSKAGDMQTAQKLFDEIPNQDVISWNTMVSGYTKTGNMDMACSLFQKIPEKNSASWNTIISGYVDCGLVEMGRSFFDSMPQRNNVSYITMISGYSKCGNVDSAREIFDQINEKDRILFNAMIACYAQNSRPKEALRLFTKMLKMNIHTHPDEMTLASVISACSQLGDMRFGSWVESFMNRLGVKIDDHLGTALTDLYAKCGSIDRAYQLFIRLKKKDLVAYSAMILGCGINGRPFDAISLFEDMIKSNVSPNLVTFTGLLTAYNHAGLVEKGYKCFHSMKDHGLEPSRDHYGIMVDLLGRNGRLDEAHDLIKSMPMKAHAGVWGALLLACEIHNNVELGEIAAQNCFELEVDTSGYCSLLSNIYASVERWDDVKRLRKIMKEKGLMKVPGCSWMESS